MGWFGFLKRRGRAEGPKVKEGRERPPKVKAGIAFGAGGTRGFAHIGVIRALEENGIDFSFVTGCSVGSIAAALYAYGLNSREMEEFFTQIRYSDIKSSRLFFVPSNSKNIENMVRRVIGEVRFDQLTKPLCISAVDLKTGEEIVVNFGEVARACAASCAVPGIFTPVEIENYRFIDGGMANPIPADVLRLMGAEKVVSVDVHSKRGPGTDSTKIVDILKASFEIGMKATAIKGIVNSDVLIQPDCHRYSQLKLENSREMIEEGYRAAMEKMDEIKALLGIRPDRLLGKEKLTESHS